MEEEAARIADGEVTHEDQVKIPVSKDAQPNFMTNLFNPPPNLQKSSPSVETLELETNKNGFPPEPPPDYDTDEGASVNPTAEEVDAALAELDSIPDAGGEGVDSSDEEEWTFSKVNPQSSAPENEMIQGDASESQEIPYSEKSASPKSGSPREVEGFITSVELNAQEENFNSNFTVNQDNVMESDSGPFSVYVSSSPEATSIEAPPLQAQSILDEAPIPTEALAKEEPPVVLSESPFEQSSEPAVEIVHAQSMVEVEPDGLPRDISDMPDIMTQSFTGELPTEPYAVPDVSNTSNMSPISENILPNNAAFIPSMEATNMEVNVDATSIQLKTESFGLNPEAPSFGIADINKYGLNPDAATFDPVSPVTLNPEAAVFEPSVEVRNSHVESNVEQVPKSNNFEPVPEVNGNIFQTEIDVQSEKTVISLDNKVDALNEVNLLADQLSNVPIDSPSGKEDITPEIEVFQKDTPIQVEAPIEAVQKDVPVDAIPKETQLEFNQSEVPDLVFEAKESVEKLVEPVLNIQSKFNGIEKTDVDILDEPIVGSPKQKENSLIDVNTDSSKLDTPLLEPSNNLLGNEKLDAPSNDIVQESIPEPQAEVEEISKETKSVNIEKPLDKITPSPQPRKTVGKVDPKPSEIKAPKPATRAPLSKANLKTSVKPTSTTTSKAPVRSSIGLKKEQPTRPAPKLEKKDLKSPASRTVTNTTSARPAATKTTTLKSSTVTSKLTSTTRPSTAKTTSTTTTRPLSTTRPASSTVKRPTTAATKISPTKPQSKESVKPAQKEPSKTSTVKEAAKPTAKPVPSTTRRPLLEPRQTVTSAKRTAAFTGSTKSAKDTANKLLSKSDASAKVSSTTTRTKAAAKTTTTTTTTKRLATTKPGQKTVGDKTKKEKEVNSEEKTDVKKTEELIVNGDH